MKQYLSLITRLKSTPLDKEEFLQILSNRSGLFGDPEEEYEYLKACGMPLIEVEGKITFSTLNTPISEQIFTIVDIETSGSKPSSAQIIEIGALKLQNGKVIDNFESLIYCRNIPEYITKITNISTKDVVDAPRMDKVLAEFRLFLDDTVFVAHNVNFDYSFISHMMKDHHLGILANRKLCTIDLARKTIESERYGLDHLTDHLGIEILMRHRAYADALAASKVLLESLKHLPEEIKTVEELIHFSKPERKPKKKKREYRRGKGSSPDFPNESPVSDPRPYD